MGHQVSQYERGLRLTCLPRSGEYQARRTGRNTCRLSHRWSDSIGQPETPPDMLRDMLAIVRSPWLMHSRAVGQTPMRLAWSAARCPPPLHAPHWGGALYASLT